MTKRILATCILISLGLSGIGLASAEVSNPAVPNSRAAPVRTFPAHQFQLAPRDFERPQVGVHFGLSQPILLRGFNIAGDLNWGRWVLEYSHGMYLDYNTPLVEDTMLTSTEMQAGLDLDSPWTTGLGIGYRVMDELALLVEFKVHKYRADVAGEAIEYKTASIGPALAWRFFLFRGLFATTYVRYWPNVWTSLDNDAKTFAQGTRHDAVDLGLFANVSVGWAFDL